MFRALCTRHEPQSIKTIISIEQNTYVLELHLNSISMHHVHMRYFRVITIVHELMSERRDYAA